MGDSEHGAMAAILLAGLSGLCGAVVVLYRGVSKVHRQVLELNRTCEQDRKKLWRAIVRLRNGHKK